MCDLDRMDEINAEMQSLNDAFDLNKASADLEYFTEYYTKVKVLSDEFRLLLNAQE